MKTLSGTSTSPWGVPLKTAEALPWQVGNRFFCADRPAIMGVLNVTPDSFFDGGKYASVDSALVRAETMISDGADILDIGGESTRPGSQAVAENEECRRVVPVIREIVKRFDVPVSIDTTKSGVAEAALSEGALIVNDVSGMTFDSRMLETTAAYDASAVLGHIQGTPALMQKAPSYSNVVDEVLLYLIKRVDALVGAGLRREKISIDPGIGFGKSVQHNYAILAGLEAFRGAECAIVVGASRKSFIGMTAGLESSDRLQPSIAAALLAALKGAGVVRVHDVRETWEQFRLFDAVLRGVPGSPG